MMMMRNCKPFLNHMKQARRKEWPANFVQNLNHTWLHCVWGDNRSFTALRNCFENSLLIKCAITISSKSLLFVRAMIHKSSNEWREILCVVVDLSDDVIFMQHGPEHLSPHFLQFNQRGFFSKILSSNLLQILLANFSRVELLTR